jgi:hypothetical protein
MLQSLIGKEHSCLFTRNISENKKFYDIGHLVAAPSTLTLFNPPGRPKVGFGNLVKVE